MMSYTEEELDGIDDRLWCIRKAAVSMQQELRDRHNGENQTANFGENKEKLINEVRKLEKETRTK